MKKILLLIGIIFSADLISQEYIYNIKVQKYNSVNFQNNPSDRETSIDFDCFNPSNIGLIGTAGECNGKLIVDNNILRNLINNNLDYSSNAIFTGQVTDMSGLFYSDFYINSVLYDITGWNTSNVLTMNDMFYGQLFNQDISNWDVSNVTEMSQMFLSARNFNQPIGKWNVSNVIDMYGVFIGAESFNQDLSNWNVSNVLYMGNLFDSARSFNQDISNWNVSNVILMTNMFRSAIAFNQDISNWCVFNIKVKPRGFDSFNSNFSSQTSKQPIWGENCN